MDRFQDGNAPLTAPPSAAPSTSYLPMMMCPNSSMSIWPSPFTSMSRNRLSSSDLAAASGATPQTARHQVFEHDHHTRYVGWGARRGPSIQCRYRGCRHIGRAATGGGGGGGEAASLRELDVGLPQRTAELRVGDQVVRRARHLTKLLEDPQERVGAPGLELLLNLGAEEVQGATRVQSPLRLSIS
jgi:hypothetical protein